MSGIDVIVGLVLLVLAWQGFSRGLVGPFVVVGIIVVTPQVASRITPVFDSLMEALSLDLPFFLHQPVIFVVAYRADCYCGGTGIGHTHRPGREALPAVRNHTGGQQDCRPGASCGRGGTYLGNRYGVSLRAFWAPASRRN